MSNEINVIGMKEYLKTLGKLFFWNFLSALSLSSLIYSMAVSHMFENPQGLVKSELERDFIRGASLGEIFLDVLDIGLLLGVAVFGVWCYFRSTKIWYNHPDTKQRKLLVSSDLVVSICCWILVVGCCSHSAPIIPYFFGIGLVIGIISLFVIKFFLIAWLISP